MAEQRFRTRGWKAAGTVLSVVVFCVALWLLHGAVRRYQFADIVARLKEVPDAAILASLVFSLLSYLALGGFDGLAMRFIGRRVSIRRTLLASFISHAISHAAGFAPLTGGAVRYRFYSVAGLSAVEVGVVVMFCGGTFVVGAASLGGLALLLEPGRFAGLSGLPENSLRALGGLVLMLVAVYAGLGAVIRRPLRVAGRDFSLPRPLLVLGQLAFAVADLAAAAAALWILLPAGAPSYPAVLGVFVLSNLAGLMAHVPGGLGVFETAVVLMLPDVRGDAVLGALVLWRATYNLVPLVLGGLLMTAFELLTRRHALERAAREVRLWLREAEPPVMALLVLLAGATLVLTGALPPDPGRLAHLAVALPAAVEQGAQVVASGVGMALMLCAPGLYRRLADAYAAAQVLLVVGAVAVLLRGLGGEIALGLSVLVSGLAATRAAFYRVGSTMPGVSPPWVGAAAVVAIASAWLTLLAFRRAAERLDLASLIDFDMANGAARALRGEVAALAVLLAGLAIIAWRGRDVVVPVMPTVEDRRCAAVLIQDGQRATAHQVLGDESIRLMFDATRRAVLAYRVSGRQWIAEGDPIGAEDAWLDLVWRFREASEAVGGVAGFVGVVHRPLYLDLGLAFAPLGERLSIDLRGMASGVRAAIRPAEAHFAVLPPDSDDPLAYPQAVLSHDGHVLAQAPLWRAQLSHQLALGPADAAAGLADQLALETMLWGARSGWHSFDLGVVAGEAVPDLLRRLPPHLVTRQPLFAALPPGLAIGA